MNKLVPLVLMMLTSQAALAPDSEPRVISVTGRGEIRAQPDRATVQLGVESRRLNLAEARSEVTRAVAVFLQYCKKLGIADKDIATSGITIQPEYSWDNNVRRLTGYFVGRNLIVNLTDLDKLGALIEGAVDQGVNQVSEPSFGLTDRDEYERRALALAAEDARRNAQALAAALNVSVGPVVSISATGPGFAPSPRPMMMRMEAAAADAGGAETYRSGEMTFSVQVDARFGIADRD
jgi:uncharacterized protein YggE